MSFWYVGSPYTKYEAGEDAAFEDVTREMAILIKAGVLAIGAITHSHPIYRAAPELGGAWETWQALDTRLIEQSCGMIVCMLPGWCESRGLQAEARLAERLGKPIVYMVPGILPDLFTDSEETT